MHWFLLLKQTSILLLIWQLPSTLQDVMFSKPRLSLITEKNLILRGLYNKFRKEGDRNIHYVSAEKLYGSDGEATVDGTHATDVGFLRMADVITPVLKPILRRR